MLPIGWSLVFSALLLGLLGSCTLHDTYPPAVPAHPVLWDNSPLVPVLSPNPEAACPPAARPLSRVALMVPTPEDWRYWQLQARPKQVCTGKGKQRRCRQESPDVIAQTNAEALVRPTLAQARQGVNGLWRYTLDPTQDRVYEVTTSPHEVTYLLLPEGERLAAPLLLKLQDWEVSYGKNGQEGARREVVVVRPTAAPLRARAVLILQSGVAIHLQLLARTQAGMLSVSWDISALRPVVPPPPTPDQLPPRFDRNRTYEGYTITVEGKKTPAPPWLPVAVVDDGDNTLVKFPGTLQGIRIPVVQGIQQTGEPALVQSRLYVRPDQGAWLYVQGLWPALRLTDAAGIKVKVVRDVPKLTEVSHAY